MIDTQDSSPQIKEDLERVGITGLKTLVITNWKGKEYSFIPEIEITIDLEKEKKGVHMSRLVESISEFVEQVVKVRYNSIEELERHILESLKKKHPYRRAEIKMKTQLIVEKKTPVTNKRTAESYDVKVTVCSENGVMKKILQTEVIGSTVCPHAMKMGKGGKTHIQRAKGTLEIETNYDNKIELEEMIKCVESSFSSEAYTLLKAKDEQWVVEKMFKNPKFVEDVTREILHKAKKKFKGCKFFAKVISYESIHRHNVLAEGRGRS